MFNIYLNQGWGWAQLITWLVTIIAVIVSSWLSYHISRKINKDNRQFNAKKEAYSLALAFVNKAQDTKDQGSIEPVNLQESAAIASQLELFATSQILDAYKELEECWVESLTRLKKNGGYNLNDKKFIKMFENPGYGIASQEKVVEFINLLKADLGIKY